MYDKNIPKIPKKKKRKFLTLNASDKAWAPSFSNRFLPEIKTFSANGAPHNLLEL